MRTVEAEKVRKMKLAGFSGFGRKQESSGKGGNEEWR